MDIVLRTYTDDPSLALVDITRFAGNSDYQAKIRLRSRGFLLLDRPFYFVDYVLSEFMMALEAMDRSLSGLAELRHPYEDDYFRLVLGPRGRVVVSGEFHERSEFNQRMYFEFETDQTVLGPFAREFSTISHLDKI